MSKPMVYVVFTASKSWKGSCEAGSVVGVCASEKAANDMLKSSIEHETKEGWDHEDIYIKRIELEKNFLIDGGPIGTSQ